MKIKYNSTQFIDWVAERNPHEPEFLQAVTEFLGSVGDIPQRYIDEKIIERMTEPERIITFRVVWQNDRGEVEVNRGYRIQMSSVLGPYKGGLRFDPNLNLSVLKFLAFEQVFKNALTGLPLGGAKGGADFDPKGRSDSEMMRFCQAFMIELFRYIGPSVDVPAGDIGVGGRELGYLFGQYKRIRGGAYENAMSGRGVASGGTYLRTEATGYGVVYFLAEMLAHRGDKIMGKTALISGSGNVAQYTAEKFIALGGKVLTMSDREGYIYDAGGIDTEKLEFIKDLKNTRHGKLAEYVSKYKDVKYVAGKHESGKRPWAEKGDIALPCSSQNELDEVDARLLIDNKILAVVEGANMPTTLKATKMLQDAGVMFAPGKASNAGGVAVSGIEMSQDSLRLRWSAKEVDERLKKIMRDIHTQCVNNGSHNDQIDYIKGANTASFKSVAEAMLAQGLV